jgi:hypothetical protein
MCASMTCRPRCDAGQQQGNVLALHIRRKAKHWLTGRFVVGGFIVGDEHSVILVGTETPAGLAYSGAVEVFGEAQLAGILSAVRARATSPFTGWAPRAVWLEPDVTVEVRYLAPGPGLRHAVLVPRSASSIP